MRRRWANFDQSINLAPRQILSVIERNIKKSLWPPPARVGQASKVEINPGQPCSNLGGVYLSERE